MEGLDSLARRYGKRPSELIGMRDPVKAVSIDLWAHNWGVQRDAYEAQERVRKGNRRGR